LVGKTGTTFDTRDLLKTTLETMSMTEEGGMYCFAGATSGKACYYAKYGDTLEAA